MVLVSGNLAQESSIRYGVNVRFFFCAAPLNTGSFLKIFSSNLTLANLYSITFLADYFGKLCLPWSNVDWH